MSSVAVVIQTQTEQTSTNCTYFRPFPSLKMTTTNALLEYVCINVDLFLWYSKQVIVKTASRNIDIDQKGEDWGVMKVKKFTKLLQFVVFHYNCEKQ